METNKETEHIDAPAVRRVTVCCSPYANAEGTLAVPAELNDADVRKYVMDHFDEIDFDIHHDYRGIDIDIYPDK